MNALDFIIIAIVSYNAFVGLKQGAVYTISGLIALLNDFEIVIAS